MTTTDSTPISRWIDRQPERLRMPILIVLVSLTVIVLSPVMIVQGIMKNPKGALQNVMGCLAIVVAGVCLFGAMAWLMGGGGVGMSYAEMCEAGMLPSRGC